MRSLTTSARCDSARASAVSACVRAMSSSPASRATRARPSSAHALTDALARGATARAAWNAARDAGSVTEAALDLSQPAVRRTLAQRVLPRLVDGQGRREHLTGRAQIPLLLMKVAEAEGGGGLGDAVPERLVDCERLEIGRPRAREVPELEVSDTDLRDAHAARDELWDQGERQLELLERQLGIPDAEVCGTHHEPRMALPPRAALGAVDLERLVQVVEGGLGVSRKPEEVSEHPEGAGCFVQASCRAVERQRAIQLGLRLLQPAQSSQDLGHRRS